MGMMAAVGACVWITAPSRSYGAVHKYPWQQMLAQLPHNVFDASGPLRQYTIGGRAAGFFSTGAQLSAVGALAGAATSAASAAAVSLRRQRTGDAEWAPSVPVPELAASSGGLAAFFAANANARYQVLGGLDRTLFSHTNAMWGYLLLSGAARVGSQYLGELSRPQWQGLATDSAARTVRRRVKRRRPAAAKEGASPAAPALAAAAVALPAAEVVASSSGAAFEGAGEASTSGSGAAGAVADAESALLTAGSASLGSAEQLQQLPAEQLEQRAVLERQLSLAGAGAGMAAAASQVAA